MLDVVGLTEYKHTKMYELSTGMKQKVNFSRGFVTNPKIVFLDEPTLGMDVGAARAIRSFLREWMAENPERTMVLTTHYMAEAEDLCDRIAIIDKGKILACDSPERLKRLVSTEVTVNVEISYMESADKGLRELQGVVNSSVSHDAETQRTKARLVVKGEDFVPRVIDYIKANGASIHLLRTSEPTLEDVFIKMVGRDFSFDTSIRAGG